MKNQATPKLTSADDILFRCSALGQIMTEPRSKSEVLSETCKNYLTQLYVEKYYGRTYDIENKFVSKGLLVEEDSLTLFSRNKGEVFIKNEKNFKNSFISGTPDVTPDQRNGIVTDIKSSWNIFTFFQTRNDKLNKNYFWQLQGYCALTGAKSASLAYCLINTPAVLIADDIRRLQWKMNVIDDTDEIFQAAAAELEFTMLYDDIPLAERVNEIQFERSDADIERIYERVKQCRTYMNETFFKSAA
jgi:hypothetical protein